jgi:serine/threonine protein phosphatase PrpC
VCALILNKKLYVAWVGDSMASLVTRDSVTQLVNPHRPTRKVNDLNFLFSFMFNRQSTIG